MSMKARILGTLITGVVATMSGATLADEFPNGPINMLVGFSAGSSTDYIARLYAPKIEEVLGEPVVVENRPGASQLVAINELVNADPDGHTLMIGTASALSQGPGVRDDLPYETMEDFVPVALFATASGVFVTSPSLPVHDMEGLVAYAKEDPGALNYGSSGLGSASNLQTELLKSIVGIDMTHIPYEGSSQIINAIIKDEVQLGIGPIQGALPSIQGEQVRPLAVTGDERSKLLPEVPSLSEVEIGGLSVLEPYTYYLIVAPKGTPQPVIEKLNAALNEVSQMPETEEALAERGFEAVAYTPEEAREYVMNNIQVWRDFKENTGFEWGR